MESMPPWVEDFSVEDSEDDHVSHEHQPPLPPPIFGAPILVLILEGVRAQNQVSPAKLQETARKTVRASRTTSAYYPVGSLRRVPASVLSPNPARHCPYLDPITGKQFTSTSKKEEDWTILRHWKSVHYDRETIAMYEGYLVIGQGTLITSRREYERTNASRLCCQHCDEFFSRKDCKTNLCRRADA
ncbi:hypothetical protein BU17DRAFT_68268 [Hysterangium stoloniferum]|nr:hypothetical protein BU17DRAFT_68268 [Hysterangium stoloniferum]